MSEQNSGFSGEFSDQGNLDPQLDPQYLVTRYLETAAMIEDPCDRALLTARFAAPLQATDPGGYSRSLVVIKHALQEMREFPDRTSGEFSFENTVFLTAESTLEEELIALADQVADNPYAKNQANDLHVKLAVARRDSKLVPDDAESQDAFLHRLAEMYGDVDSVRKIADPATKAQAFNDVFTTLEEANFNPVEWISLEDEAWQTITNMPEDKYSSRNSLVVRFAVKHGTAFIERLKDAELRHNAYRNFAEKVKMGDEYAPDRDWLKQKLIEESPTIISTDEAVTQRIVRSIAYVAEVFADPEFADYALPDILYKTKPQTVAVALQKKAIRELNADLAWSMPVDLNGFYKRSRDYALSEIAAATNDLELAHKIPDEHYRLQALGVIAGNNQDPELKETVKNWTLENIKPEDDYRENFGVADIIASLRDPAISRLLLTTPNITSMTLSQVAEQTGDADLALSIPNARTREAVLSKLAVNLKRPDLLDAVPDMHPHHRASALYMMHRAVTGITPRKEAA